MPPGVSPATGSAASYVGRAHASVGQIPRETWDSLLPGEAESWDYYRAIEEIPPSDAFRLGAIAVYDGARVVAVAPLMEVTYRLDTPLHGTLRRVTDMIHARAPSLVSVPVVALGSPMTDTLRIGFDPGLDGPQRLAAATAMLAGLEAEARRLNAAVVALKGLDGQAAELHPAMAARSYSRVTSVPLVMVDLPPGSLETYLAGLPAKTRSYLKRKARTMPQVVFEEPVSVVDIEPELHELLGQSLERSQIDHGEFERLAPDYFSRVKSGLGDNALVTLCRHEGRLIGFQLSLLGANRIVTKQIGISHPVGRDLNLYFLNWLRLVEAATARGITSIELGATAYATKLMLGGRLERRWLYYRFRSSVLNTMLKPAGSLFDFERNDPELRQLDPEHLARIR